MRFRARILLAILVPAVALVAAAAGSAILAIRRGSEAAAGEELERTRHAFDGVLRVQLDQLKIAGGPFHQPRIDAAITDFAESKEIAQLKAHVENEFLYLQHAPDLYEVRSRKGDLILRHSPRHACGPACAHPPEPWMAERERALTEFDGQPFMAIIVRHEKGYFVLGTDLRRTLDGLSADFGVGLGLLRGGRVVYTSLPGWTTGAGTEGTVWVGGVRHLALSWRPRDSELELVALLKSMADVDRRQAAVAWLGAAGVALAGLAAGLASARLSRGISRPVETLVEATRRVGGGDYSAEVDIPSRDEMGALGRAFNDMTAGLRRRREIMEKTLSRDVAEELMKGMELGGERQEATILFMDIRGFTPATEGADPADVVAMINEMMARLAEAIARHGGNVNKYLGDGLMAMFGAPRPLEDHAFRAVGAAREMQREMAAWNAGRQGRGLPPLGIGIGINTGVVVGGRVGSASRLEYTLIGEEVNLASRVCGKAASGQILVTKATRTRLGDRVPARELEPVQVKGLSYPVAVFEVGP